MLDRDALEDSDEALSQIKRVSLLDELKEREICWYDPREPDFPAELLSRPSQSSIHSFLYPGAAFQGTQRNRQHTYDVQVEITVSDTDKINSEC